MKGRRKYSFRTSVIGANWDTLMEEGDGNEDGEIIDDYIMEDGVEGPWFLMGMTKDEK